MSESTYHWRDYAADEEKADIVRMTLGMPYLEFESSDVNMFVVFSQPLTPEMYKRLERMGCTPDTLENGLTRVSFARSKHLADSILSALRIARYVLVCTSAVLLAELFRSARQSDFFSR